MNETKYRIIDHTADIGVHVYGADPQKLFANAAYALFDLITDLKTLKGDHTKKITVTGENWSDLMVNWLRELLYFWAGRERLVKQAEILAISQNKLIASLKYDPYDPNRHIIKDEIKAVTYHQLEVKSGPSGWEARIIFDV